MEIFNMKLASQQHQHEVGNHQHEASISTKSTRRWKSSAQSWNLNNIDTKLEIFSMRLASQKHNTKLEIFNTRLASQQHQHEAGNLQHKAGITTTPPFEGGPFGL
jgi:hypothetical protein